LCWFAMFDWGTRRTQVIVDDQVVACLGRRIE
jgi:hypothetical protein